MNYYCKDGISFQITPVGGVWDGMMYKVTIQVPFEVGWIERMKFLVSRDKERFVFQLNHVKNEGGLVFFETTVELMNYAVYHFCFSFEANRVFQYLKKKNITAKNCITLEESWKMSVGFDVPDWAKGANMYHIFVDRYKKGRLEPLEPMPNRTIHENWDEKPVIGPDEKGNWNIDFFGGDLKGIEKTIKYIKRMGFTILYLSPIMRSQSNHRYDTANYEEVDPYVGTNEDLRSLCSVAHKHGMRVILDAVFNHTGNDSIYFNEYGTYDSVGAYQSEASPFYNFYRHYWDGTKNVFSYWWGMKNLPVCDGNSWEWKAYILGEGGVIDEWFSLGIDGLRADVADELSDDFIKHMRDAIKRNKPDGLFIGEVWYSPMRMNRGYLSSGKGMDSVMNYNFISSMIHYFKYADYDKLDNTITEIQTEYPDDSILTGMNFTSTHDISRDIEIFGCDDFNRYGEWPWNLLNNDLNWIKNHKLTKEQYKHGKEVFKVYFFALTFMPGILSVFYGDEVGLQGIGNLANRATYPWGRRDKDLLKFVRKCLNIRNKYEFLKKADWNILSLDKDKLMFERVLGNEKILVIVNRTNETLGFLKPEEYDDAELVLAVNSNGYYLRPYGALAFKI